MRREHKDLLPQDQIETGEACAMEHVDIVESTRRAGVVIYLQLATASAPIRFRVHLLGPDHVATSGKGPTLVRHFWREANARG